jgi:hypothetical protein
MPIRHGGIVVSRVSIWPRDNFCRSTIVPRPGPLRRAILWVSGLSYGVASFK